MGDATVPGFLEVATQPAVVKRALGYAVVVGVVLIAINHGDEILAGDIDVHRVWRMALTVLVPYAVSTLSSVSAIRQGLRQGIQARSSQ